MISKSIIENFQLESGVEVYVQSSARGLVVSDSPSIVLSFDSMDNSFVQHLSMEDAKTLAKKLKQVIREAAE